VSGGRFAFSRSTTVEPSYLPLMRFIVIPRYTPSLRFAATHPRVLYNIGFCGRRSGGLMLLPGTPDVPSRATVRAIQRGVGAITATLVTLRSGQTATQAPL
jgi:hypothetical protein